jgi:tetratricopeptide (TPR) repeat protein
MVAGCSALTQSNRETGTELAKAYYDRALGYTHKGDYDNAARDYDQALRINPHYADAFRERGIDYTHRNDYGHAIQDYDQALRLNPNDAIAFYDRGQAFGHQRGADILVGLTRLVLSQCPQGRVR